MPLKSIDPTKTSAWNLLKEHYKSQHQQHLKDLFVQDPDRASDLSLQWQDFLVDFSKNRITRETLDHLIGLAEEMDLKDAIDKYFNGDLINQTEGRAVLHTALRTPAGKSVIVNGSDVVPEVQEVKAHIKEFANAIISGEKKGYSGKAFKAVVNIGIGGSDLGPAMVTEALKYYQNHLQVHFVSNVDGDHVHEVLKHLDPETTLFVVVSKTFTTQETLSNATTIKNWFLQYGSQEDTAAKCSAISS